MLPEDPDVQVGVGRGCTGSGNRGAGGNGGAHQMRRRAHYTCTLVPRPLRAAHMRDLVHCAPALHHT